MTDQFEGWKKLLKGEQVPLHENEPMPGYYRTRMGKDGPWVPVAIWRDGETLYVTRAGKVVDIGKVWPFCANNPVSYQAFVDVSENGKDWPDLHPAVQALSNNPPAEETFETLAEAITDLARDAEKLVKAGGAKSQEEADRAAHLANKLAELQGKGDILRKKEKNPHDEAAKAVQTKWLPILTAADIYKRIKLAVVTPFLQEQERKRLAAEAVARRQQAELEAAQRRATEDALRTGAPVPEPVAPTPAVMPSAPPKAGSGGRRTVALRTVRQITIEDRAKVLEFFADSAAITDLLQTMAEKAVRAGVNVPGTKVIETQVAA